MINGSSQGESVLGCHREDDILRKNLPMICIDKERKLRGRRRTDTVRVLTTNNANYRLEIAISAPYDQSKSLGPYGSIVAWTRLKRSDAREPSGVNLAA